MRNLSVLIQLCEVFEVIGVFFQDASLYRCLSHRHSLIFTTEQVFLYFLCFLIQLFWPLIITSVFIYYKFGMYFSDGSDCDEEGHYSSFEVDWKQARIYVSNKYVDKLIVEDICTGYYRRSNQLLNVKVSARCSLFLPIMCFLTSHSSCYQFSRRFCPACTLLQHSLSVPLFHFSPR